MQQQLSPSPSQWTQRRGGLRVVEASLKSTHRSSKVAQRFPLGEFVHRTPHVASKVQGGRRDPDDPEASCALGPGRDSRGQGKPNKTRANSRARSPKGLKFACLGLGVRRTSQRMSSKKARGASYRPPNKPLSVKSLPRASPWPPVGLGCTNRRFR